MILIILAHLAHLPQSYFSLIIIGFNTHNCSLFYLTNSQYCSDWRKKHGENWPMLMTFSLTAIAPITGLGKSRRIPSAFLDLRRNLNFPFSHEWFLVACVRLFTPLCRSVCRSVCQSVIRSHFPFFLMSFLVILSKFKSFKVILSHSNSF